jgi:hypothetical protein
MKNIRITEDCLVKGDHVPSGTILKNTPNELAAELLTSGRAEIVAAASDEIVIPDPEVSTRDPEPKKGKSAK